MRGPRRVRDALDSFDGFVGWLSAARVLDDERASRPAPARQQQPTGSSAALHEARRLRNVLRALAERGDAPHERTTQTAIGEINRILGRSAGTRRVEPRMDGGFVRNFVTAGDVFAGLMIPIIESAADALVSRRAASGSGNARTRDARVCSTTGRGTGSGGGAT